ncbi:MAG: hypothetical protein ACRDKA_10615 [Actinomycetota bacterium]
MSEPVVEERVEAFEDFCHANFQRLFRAMYLATGDRHEAEDLAQDAYASHERGLDLLGYATGPDLIDARIVTYDKLSPDRHRGGHPLQRGRTHHPRRVGNAPDRLARRGHVRGARRRARSPGPIGASRSATAR